MTHERSPLVVVNGPAVRHLRSAVTSYSVRSLATQVGLSFSHMAKVERGIVRSVRPAVFDALVLALDVTDPRVLMANPHAARSVAAPAVPDAA